MFLLSVNNRFVVEIGFGRWLLPSCVFVRAFGKEAFLNFRTGKHTFG